MSTATKRQTAANNPFLARVKRAMNVPTFKHASHLMNTDGPEAARAFVQGFFLSNVDESLDSLVAALDARKK